MADSDDREITRVMKVRQDDRARQEQEDATDATAPAEELMHRRRAEKAAYLRDKLAEAERSTR